jgi:prepilin signal peptidase PulO-like enzyme (type II secretory pathway)
LVWWIGVAVLFGILAGVGAFVVGNRLLVASAREQLFPEQEQQFDDAALTEALVRTYDLSLTRSITHPQCLLMAVLCTALALWAAWQCGWDPSQTIGAWIIVSIGVLITRTDVIAQLIHDKVVIAFTAIALVYRFFSSPLPWWDYAIAAVLASALLWMLGVVSRGGMGWGDIKLYICIGVLCGIQVTMLSLFVASVCGLLVGGTMRIVGTLPPKSFMPFGPFIALGTYVSYLYSDVLIDAYRGLIGQFIA